MLPQHVADSVTSRGERKKFMRRSNSAIVVDEEQKRAQVLAARERLVRETLERER